MKTKALGLMVFLLLFGSQSWTQEKAQDRRKFLDPKTPVSDDPRRTVVKPGPRGPEGTLVLRNGRIFDGTGAPAREGTLVIERNKVVKILPPGSTDWPKDAHVVDVSGKTVLPGLTDLHTHLTYALNHEDIGVAMNDADATLRAVEKLRYFIESGITSVRDVGSKGDVTFRLKVWVAENRIAGPRVFPAGAFITGEGGHSTENTPDEIIGLMGATRLASGPDDWRQAVREQFHKGADVIKLGSHFSAEEVKAAVTEAHELGLKVTVDAETFYIQRAVEAGWSVPEALVAATKTNAEILDMDDRLGTLQPGKLADALVVDGRPDENLDDLATVDLVIRDGYEVVEGGHLAVPRHTAEKPGKSASSPAEMKSAVQH